MLLSDELDKFDKHADIALRRIVRAWGADLSEDSSEQLSADQLKVEMSGVGEGELPPQWQRIFDGAMADLGAYVPLCCSGSDVRVPAVYLAGGPFPPQGCLARALD